MKAITLWPEWVAAVAYLGKDVENRGDGQTRHALHGAVGQRVALHAGKTLGGSGSTGAAFGNLMGFELTCRFAVGRRVEVRKGLRVGGATAITIPCSALYVSAVIGEPVTDHPSRWAVPDAWHFPLLDVLMLPEPVLGVRGSQGLWNAPDIDWSKAKAAEVLGG